MNNAYVARRITQNVQPLIDNVHISHALDILDKLACVCKIAPHLPLYSVASKMTGAKLPSKISRMYNKFADDPDSLMEAGTPLQSSR